jgi:hypothetical protein
MVMALTLRRYVKALALLVVACNAVPRTNDDARRPREMVKDDNDCTEETW